MKKLLICITILLCTTVVHAQPDIIGLDPASKDHSTEADAPERITMKNDSVWNTIRWARMSGVYLECGMHAGSAGFGMGLMGIRYRFNEKWMMGLSILAYQQPANNTPSDYNPGTGTFFFISTSSRQVLLQRQDLSLTVGRTMKMSPRSWFSTEAGLSMLKGQKVIFTPQQMVTNDPLLMLFGISGTTSNYSKSVSIVNVIGAVVRTDLNFRVSPSLVISTGTYMNFNSLKTPLSFQLRFLVGPFIHK